MIRIASKIWKTLPRPVRLRLVRATQPKFTVSVVAIILNADDHVLILDHFIRPGASWGLPGGFIDPDENPDDAIRREIMEEAGIELDSLKFVRIRTVLRHLEILYIARSSGTVKLPGSEIRDFGWFPPDALPQGISILQDSLIKTTLASEVI